MANIEKMVALSEEDWAECRAQGSITKKGITVVYSPSDVYLTDYASSELIDDSNSTKKFVSVSEKTNIATIPQLTQDVAGKQDQFMINGQAPTASSDVKIDEIYLGTSYSTAPTAPYERASEGYYKVIRLASEPANKYAGYIYLINQ